MAMRGGLDLGGTKIQAVVIDDEHQVRGEARDETPVKGGPPEVAATMAGVLREAAAQAGVDPADLRGVGVGSPGQVDTDAGTVAAAKNLPGWDGSFALAGALRDALGTEVRVTNDVGAAADGETRLGAGREFGSFLGVFWGTGVGGAVVLGGARWRGRGFGGEFGHMCVKRDGAVCPACGNRGCVEAYAGRRSMEERARRLHEHDGRKTDLFKIAKERNRPRLTSGVWDRALRRKDPLAEELVERAVLAIAAGAASAVNLLDVEAVVLGGGLGIRFGEPMAERLLKAMEPNLFVKSRRPAVHVAALGDLGGAIGASLLVAPAPSAVG
jgi:glucokinase